MNLFRKLRYMPKQIGIFLAVITAAVGTVAAFAWGPSRETYTQEKPADHIVFNSMIYKNTNGETVDERNFVVVKDAANTSAGGWQDSVTVEAGKEYLVRFYVHNNAASTLNLTATNTRVMAALGTNTGTKVNMTGYVTADNANPKQVWDEISFNSDKNFNMAYVSGSSRLYNNATGVAGRAFSDTIMNGSGALVGYTKDDGNYPGCFQYVSYITFKVKPQFQQTVDFTLVKDVRKNGTTDKYVQSITANPGDKVDYRIAFKNIGTAQLDNIVIKDTLPAGVTYVPGTAKLQNSIYQFPNTYSLPDTLFTTGANIGHYAPGGAGYVTFTGQVAAKDKLAVCGVNTLKNVVKAESDHGFAADDAFVTVTKDCPEPPKKVTVCDPADRTIKQVSETDKSKYLPVDSEKCQTIKVCVIETGELKKTIFKDQFDSKKYSTNEADCKKQPGTPVIIPSTGPGALLASLSGVSALTYGAYTYAASRRALRNAKK